MDTLYVQFGCGRTAPEEWKNYDASLSLWVQKTPILGWFFPRRSKRFPKNVIYGDIIKGLPGVRENSCTGIFCSHVLEHLAKEDFRKSLINIYSILKPGGTFRLIIPNLEPMARSYIEEFDKGNDQASTIFIGNTWMGRYDRPRGIRGMIQSHFTFTFHLWMWDPFSMKKELENAGFKDVHVSSFGENKDPMFSLLEEESKYHTAFGMECTK